jgi:creatinine amidohydrolase
MPIEFAKISALKLESLCREKTVFFFPVGPLEDHGPHLPFDLDLQEASYLSFLSGQCLEKDLPDWTAVLMPGVPLGIDSNTTRFTITVRPYVLRDWLVDACQGLRKNGFCHFVCFTGHLGPKQLTVIEEAGRLLSLRSKFRFGSLLPFYKKSPAVSFISANSLMVSWRDVLHAPFWLDPIEHGGAQDTSIALCIAKDLVPPCYKALPALQKPPSFWSRWHHGPFRIISGYWGDPSSATIEKGENSIKENLIKIFPNMMRVWKREKRKPSFLTWYCIFPMNRSSFKSWLLVFFSFFLMLLAYRLMLCF